MKSLSSLVLLLLISTACSGVSVSVSLGPTATPVPSPTLTPKPVVTVPNVGQQSPDKAIALLQDANLRGQKVEEPANVCIGSVVLRQDPAPGAQVDADSIVKVYTCVGPTPTAPATATPRPTNTPAATALPTLAGPPRQLKTGTIVKQNPNWQAGDNNSLTVENSQPLDGVIVLLQDNIVMIAVYLRTGETYKNEEVWHGQYNLYFTLGEDWDSASATFTRKNQYHRFSNVLDFQRNVNRGVVNYVNYNAKLFSGADTVPAAQFPKLK